MDFNVATFIYLLITAVRPIIYAKLAQPHETHLILYCSTIDRVININGFFGSLQFNDKYERHWSKLNDHPIL